MIDNSTPIYSKKTLENFNENENNQRVIEAAKKLATGENSSDLLYIFGNAGTGKSHLLNAIGVRALLDNPDLRVLKTTAEDIRKDFLESLSQDTVNHFRCKYMDDADLILIDDISRLKGRLNIQKEIAFLIEKLLENNKRIAVAGRIPPEIMLSDEYDIDFVNVMRSGYSFSTDFPFGTFKGNLRRTLVRDICDILDKCLFHYSVEKDLVGNRYNIIVPIAKLNYHPVFINCNPNSERVTILLTINIDPLIMEERRLRLLDACNIISRYYYLNAVIYDDALLVSYEIPPQVGDAMEHIVKEGMRYFENLDLNLIDKALNTDEDLYE